MEKLVAITALIAFSAGPAFAAKTTIEFASDDGQTTTMVFDDEAGMVTDEAGNSMPYTYDDASATLCGQSPDGEICATFVDPKAEPQVGDSAPYTTNVGTSGTATITAIEVAEPSGS